MYRPLHRLMIGFLFLGVGCGSKETFELTIVNTVQSSEAIRIDLGGEVRTLDIGEITTYRSVEAGNRILSIESPTCSGTIRDTVSVRDDITALYLMTRDPATGECMLSSNVTATRAVPISTR